MISSAVVANPKPLKSILKKPSSSPPQASREDHHKQLALYHAHLVQHRKDIENAIFESLEALIDFPSPQTTDPAHPAVSDIVEVKKLLRSFQPADLDALIEERNINKKCGHVLCPRPNHQENTSGRFRLLVDRDGGHKDLKVVPIKDLEKWCSDDCGKRMLYLRVQLSDTPAWERARSTSEELALYGEESSPTVARDSLAQLHGDLQRLALERGENQPNEAPSAVSVQLKEREISSHQADPMISKLGEGQQTIEGYLPRLVEEMARAAIATDSHDMTDLM